MRKIAAGLKQGAQGISEASTEKPWRPCWGCCFPHSLTGKGKPRAARPASSFGLDDREFREFWWLERHNLLSIGLLFCVGGPVVRPGIYVQLKNLPVHRSMREISELIYETCKTYLVTQGKFILLLWHSSRSLSRSTSAG